MATGIAARFIDGLVQDKHRDPAVVVVDEAARFAIALVGGHEGGANALAYRVANAVGATPVVTTATEAIKPLVVGIGCRRGATADQIEAAVLRALALPGARSLCGGSSAELGGAQDVALGGAQDVALGGAQDVALGRGQDVALGRGQDVARGGGRDVALGGGQDAALGGGRGASLGGRAAGARTDEASVSLRLVRELVTVDLKASEPGLVAFSQRAGIPLRIIAKHQIETRAWVTQPSEWVRQSVGLDGVCEPCALIACPRGTLVVPKTTWDGVAVAIVADDWSRAP
jgi:cobalamin biosynthesis protein CbiG